MASQFNLKPEDWPFERFQIDSEWDDFYEDIVFAYAYLDGRVVDLLTGEVPDSGTIGNSVPVATPYGLGIDHSGRLQFDAPYKPLNPDNNHVTVCSFFKWPGTGRRTVICQREATNERQIEIRSNGNLAGASDGDLAFLYNVTQADKGGCEITTTTLNEGQDYIVHAVVNGGSDLKLYIDGVDLTDAKDNVSGSMDNNDSAVRFVLGGLPDTTTLEFVDDKYLDVGWNKTMTPAQITQHVADRFGPFTTELSLPAWFTPAVGGEEFLGRQYPQGINRGVMRGVA